MEENNNVNVTVEEPKKPKKKAPILTIILIIIIIGLLGLLGYTNKDKLFDKKENNLTGVNGVKVSDEKIVKENTKVNTSDIYGFAVLEEDNNCTVIELHSDSQDQEIFSLKCNLGFGLLTIINDKLYINKIYEFDYNGDRKVVEKSNESVLIKNIRHYSEMVAAYDQMFLIKNGKEVRISNKEIYYNDKLIATNYAEDPLIILGYSKDENIITYKAIYQISHDGDHESKKYEYNIQTGEIKEIENNIETSFIYCKW